MANLFITFHSMSTRFTLALAEISEWFFTYQIEFDTGIFTPIEIMLGAGLIVYLTFTLIKYIVS